MSSIVARIIVAAPLASGARLVGTYFAVHQQPDGGDAVIALTPNDRLRASVTVTLSRTHLSGEMTPHFHIAWTPLEHGLYPDFTGTLAVNADEDYNSCVIEIAGSYDPPLGLPGKIFDVVMGRSIAHATADHFLASLRDFVEHDFRLEEARKTAT